jgi:membrane associated rhomboid family serine protease
MILLPIGHEQESTRRLPAVTFGIMILCAAAFFATDFGGSRSEWDEVEAHERAVEYWMEHPYLEPDPQLVQAATGRAARADTREALVEGMRSSVEPPSDRALVRSEQEQLDRLWHEATRSAPDHPFERWGLVPSRMSIATILTHMFLHAGWLHILGNLFILYLSGPFIEDVWGRAVFAAFYLAAGVVAALAFALPNAELGEPLVGASGAIAGVMGAFAIRHWSTKLKFFYAFGFVLRGTFWAPAWLMLGLWLGQQLLLAALTSGGASESGGGVAYSAHVGGFVFGAIVAVLFRAAHVENRFLAPGIEARTQTVVLDNTEVEKALGMAEAGNPETAWKRLEAETRRSPANIDAALALWALAIQVGRTSEAAPHAVRAIQDELRRGQTDLALDHWFELRHHVPTVRMEPQLLLRIAAALAAEQPKEAVEALRRALLAAATSRDPALSLKIAAAAVDLDPGVARTALEQALSRPHLDAAGRAAAEALRARLAATCP